jgi:hypothetical protein
MNVSTIMLRIRNKLRLLWGTPRRFLLNLFRPGYVRESLAQRSGECLRCGACCRLVVKCIFCFKDKAGLPACRSYNFRNANCSKFPFDSRDIADRDLIAPHSPCGYSWGRKGKKSNKS